MTEKTYRIYNLGLGWTVFTIALFTFGSTVEPTASFWDAGEYIATSAKLQVGHPPGAPFFQMMGAFFALFATGQQNIAVMVNFMSVFFKCFYYSLSFLDYHIIIKKITLFQNFRFNFRTNWFFRKCCSGGSCFLFF